MTWRPELRTYFRTHAAARLSEVEAILAMDITPPPAPPAVDVRGYPSGTAAQVQRRQQLAAKDTAARSAMKELHATLLGLQAERAGGGDPPSASRSPVETAESAVPPFKKKGKK